MGARISPCSAEKWKRSAIKAADRCSIACWSRGVDRDRHPIRLLVVGAAGEHHVFVASMCVGCVSVRRTSLITMSVTHYMTYWMLMNASAPDTSCFSGFGVLSFESVHAISANGSMTRKPAGSVRS